MSDFHKKAIEVAGIFGECRGIQTHPATPHTNTFIVQFSKGNGKYMEARDGVALETGLWLFDYMPKIEPESGAFEVHIWEGGLRCSLEELKNAFILFLRYIDAEADSVAAPVLNS